MVRPLYPQGKELRYPLDWSICLDIVENEKKKFFKLTGLELRLLGRPAHIRSLYQLLNPISPLTLCRSGKETAQKTPFATILCCCRCIRCHGKVFTVLLLLG
jgi:hypothetical protein